jgi:hypothetical protein
MCEERCDFIRKWIVAHSLTGRKIKDKCFFIKIDLAVVRKK